MENQEFDSTNINTLWLNNIYENLKNLEQMERITREGCSSIMDYLQIPQEQRGHVIGDTQYKNLRFIVTEINLLLTDLTPVMNKTKIEEFRQMLNKIEDVIHIRYLFLEEPTYTSNRIKTSTLKPFFWETLGFLMKMRVGIIGEIAHLLFVDKKESKTEIKPRLR